MGIAYNPRIVTDGLVLALDAGNTKSYPGSGTSWSDVSANGNNGTLTNGPTYSSSYGGSLSFDGVNDYVATNNFSIDFGTGSFTLCAWIITSNNTQQGKIINKGQSIAFPQGSKGYSLRFYGRAFFSVGDGTTFTSLATVNVNDIPNNTWKYFVGVCNRSTNIQSIYIDGITNNNASIQYGSTSNPNAELTIGNLERGIYGTDSEFFNGNISQVSIYNRALSAAEVQQNFNATRGRFGI
jgi:hypothetical protein